MDLLAFFLCSDLLRKYPWRSQSRRLYKPCCRRLKHSWRRDLCEQPVYKEKLNHKIKLISPIWEKQTGAPNGGVPQSSCSERVYLLAGRNSILVTLVNMRILLGHFSSCRRCWTPRYCVNRVIPGKPDGRSSLIRRTPPYYYNLGNFTLKGVQCPYKGSKNTKIWFWEIQKSPPTEK